MSALSAKTKTIAQNPRQIAFEAFYKGYENLHRKTNPKNLTTDLFLLAIFLWTISQIYLKTFNLTLNIYCQAHKKEYPTIKDLFLLKSQSELEQIYLEYYDQIFSSTDCISPRFAWKSLYQQIQSQNAWSQFLDMFSNVIISTDTTITDLSNSVEQLTNNFDNPFLSILAWIKPWYKNYVNNIVQEFELAGLEVKDLGQILNLFNEHESVIDPEFTNDVIEGVIKIIDSENKQQKTEKAAIFTAPSVAKLAAKLLFSQPMPDANNNPHLNIFDYACGSGTLLGAAYDELMHNNHKTPYELRLFANDIDHDMTSFMQIKFCLYYTQYLQNEDLEKTVNLIWNRYNQEQLISSHQESDIKNNNALTDPPFNFGTFDFVIANPPWGLKHSGQKSLRLEDIIPNLSFTGKQDWHWILLAAAFLNQTGRAVIIHSVAITNPRGEDDEKIIEYLINEKILVGIIFLSNKLFIRTDNKCCILILDKNKSQQESEENDNHQIFMMNFSDPKMKIVNNEPLYIKNQTKASKLAINPTGIETILNIWEAKTLIDNQTGWISAQAIRDHKYRLDFNSYLHKEVTIDQKSTMTPKAVFAEISELLKTIV